jgi:nucleotide-binding universal stress UspA family protein
MYKKILVPLDGSKRAEIILPHVEEIALNLKSKLLFLFVVDPSFDTFGPHGTLPEMSVEVWKRRISDAEIYLSSLEGEFREKGITAGIFVEKGHVVNTIIQVANREDVDLIAMASHGRTGLSRVFYGSVAAGVLHRVDRPLLLIRSRENAK